MRSDEVMDPKVWRRIPKDLLERVLSFLPLKTFLSLRSTCKHFHSLLFSPPFITTYSSSFSSFFLLSHPQFSRKYPLFDTVHGSWRHLSISLPSPVLLSSSNGLLCFSIQNSNSFVISNLISNTSRLVKFPILPFSIDSLTLASLPDGSYKILVIKSSQPPWKSTFVYDSSDHSWRKFQDFKPALANCINHHQEGILHRGSLHFITPEPFRVYCFDFDSGEWQRAAMEMPAADLTFARLVSDAGGGKLYLVGGVGRNGISRSMKLWERKEEDGGERWAEVEGDSVPEMMCRKLMSVCYHNYEHVYCFWHQGLVCICCYTWPEILYYKVSRKTWHWLPRCPSLPDKWSCGFRWFSFVPQLYASV